MSASTTTAPVPAPGTFLDSGPAGAPCRLLLAHGAGAAMTSPFMEQIAALLAERGIAVSRFEFAYMAARRTEDKRRPPPKAERLIPEYDAAIATVLKARPPGQRLFIGGKSMGGRMASMVAGSAFANREISGLVCLGYPFHPPGQPQTWRTQHLVALASPTLIVQGERDPFGSRAEVEALKLSDQIAFHWLGDGDHDFGPRGASGFTRKGNLTAAAEAIAAFVAA
ncbi:MAG: alpha/beta family hydrolase [Hyphomicrobium sp.]